jgi:hypothetical protein
MLLVWAKTTVSQGVKRPFQNECFLYHRGVVINFILFLWRMGVVYRKCMANESGSTYTAIITRNGVPSMCCFIATGREAWRVSQLAIESKKWVRFD